MFEIKKWNLGSPFTFLGRTYNNINEIRYPYSSIGRYKLLKDKYGNPFLYVFERYPCFDEFDYMHENRYYNWYFAVDSEDQALEALTLLNHRELLNYYNMDDASLINRKANEKFPFIYVDDGYEQFLAFEPIMPGP